MPQLVRHSGDERSLWPDDHEIGGERPCEREQAVAVVRRDRMTRGELGDPGVPRRGMELGQLWRCRKSPRERVLPTTGPDKEDTHRPSLRA